MRELRCVCGARPVAANDEELAHKVLEHAHNEHPEMKLTEEQAREMVASQASDADRARG